MFGLQTGGRRALLAALATLPLSGWTDITARFDDRSGTIAVSGLTPEALTAAVANPETVKLRVSNSPSERGMLVTLAQQEDALVLAPRFGLRPGTAYVLAVAGETLALSVPAPEAPAPRLAAFAPSQAVIPANTLRLYLHFSEPMARGQLREAVSLITDDGTPVASPFLSLETELWDRSQTRATLLLDPGRIKQGVGPNVTGGAPLQSGQSYRLTIAPNMGSAAGVPIGEAISVAFRVGAPERRAIAAEAWQLLPPTAGSLAPLSIAFDRIMDSGAARRLIDLRGPDGARIEGRITTDGGGWSLIPDRPWQPGRYSIVVDPELEDVAGNALGAPFDAAPGTIGSTTGPVILTLDLTAQ